MSTYCTECLTSMSTCCLCTKTRFKVKRETLEGRRIFFTKNRPPSLLICALIDLPFSKSIKVCKIDFLLDFWNGLMKKQYVKSENRKEGVDLCAILYAPFGSYAPFLIFWFTYCFFHWPPSKSIEDRENRFSLPTFWSGLMKKQYVKSENRKRSRRTKTSI